MEVKMRKCGLCGNVYPEHLMTTKNTHDICNMCMNNIIINTTPDCSWWEDFCAVIWNILQSNPQRLPILKDLAKNDIYGDDFDDDWDADAEYPY